MGAAREAGVQSPGPLGEHLGLGWLSGMLGLGGRLAWRSQPPVGVGDDAGEPVPEGTPGRTLLPVR